MSVAYHANYFIWFEVGRSELLRSLGKPYRSLETTGLYLPVIEAHCEFREPARYDDLLNIVTVGSLVSPVRIQFHYDIFRQTDKFHLATGHTVHASINQSEKPYRLPQDIQAVLR
jgi:acyl-CoA thioester hydrolase